MFNCFFALREISIFFQAPLWLLPLAYMLTPISLGMAQGDQQTDVVAEEAGLWQSDIKPFLTRYCSACHSGEGAEADINFDDYDSPALLPNERPRWDQVRGMIEIGAMPPPDYDPLPSPEEREKVAHWIDRKINSVDCQVPHDPGRVTLRRLNSAEYDNTLRDILAIDFSPSELVGFPSDSVGNGFDNQGDVLTMSPLQLEKYLQAAKLVASQIVVHDVESLRSQQGDIGSLYAGDRDSVAFLTAAGKYEITARLKFEDDKEKQAIPVVILIDEQEIPGWEIRNKYETFKLNFDFTEGWHEISLHFAHDPYAKNKEYRRRIETDFIGIHGPEDGLPAVPESHRRVFTAYPSENKTTQQAASEIFQPLIRRAFRRTPQPIEIERVVNLVVLATEQGESFEDAVSIGLQTVLTSPNFLFRMESQSANVSEDSIAPLDDFALASRLSYFIWASTPDDTLLDLASQGKLSEAGILKSEVQRLLTDPRSEALVDRFFAQHLGLGNLREVEPEGSQFPLWNDRLRSAMQKETKLFCREIVEHDLPVSELLVGNFTYINPRLAELYGLPFAEQDPQQLYFDGPGYKRERGASREGLYREEERWLRVSLPPDRQGVLTQAAVLTLTSNPTSTSPVKRGKWILESLLGDPPPPAPPNVPGFEETQKEHGNLTLRQQLEIHRANPSCASCHRVMDPLGLGFENFDAIGQWRDRDGVHPIDATGELSDGRKFTGSTELVQLLQTRQPEMLRHFSEQLLTYALGRGLEPYDNCAIDIILDTAEKNEYRLSSFVKAIVTSIPFRFGRLEAELNHPERNEL